MSSSPNDLSAAALIVNLAEVLPDEVPSLEAPLTEHVTIGTKVMNATAIIVPFLGLIAAVALTWGWGVSWFELAMLLVGYLLTAGGVTIGFHRYFTHKSYSCPRWVQWVIAICASASMQGTLLGWCATHRCHHQHSDRPGDPHSPHIDEHDEEIGHDFMGVLRGMWHSHMGWLFVDDSETLVRYIPDLKDDKVCRTVSNWFGFIVIASLVLPAVLGGLYHHSWQGVLMGFLWGGLVRIFTCHHVTWSINSACHIWGKRTYNSPDHSKNNVLFGILALGEGWHNNHHTFPASARHGLEWWQLDLTYITIKTMSFLGLAWDIKIPPKARRDAKRVAA